MEGSSRFQSSALILDSCGQSLEPVLLQRVLVAFVKSLGAQMVDPTAIDSSSIGLTLNRLEGNARLNAWIADLIDLCHAIIKPPDSYSLWFHNDLNWAPQFRAKLCIGGVLQ